MDFFELMYPVVDTVKKGGRKHSWCNRRSVNGVVFFKKGALISLRVLKLRDVWTYAAGARWTCCVGKQTFPSHPDGLSRSPSRQFHVWKGLSQRNQFVRRPSNQGDFTESLLATLIASSSVTWYVCYLSMAAGKVKVPLLLPKIFIADRMKRKCLGNLPMAHPASLLHKKSIHRVLYGYSRVRSRGEIERYACRTIEKVWNFFLYFQVEINLKKEYIY